MGFSSEMFGTVGAMLFCFAHATAQPVHNPTRKDLKLVPWSRAVGSGVRAALVSTSDPLSRREGGFTARTESMRGDSQRLGEQSRHMAPNRLAR